MTSAWNRIWDAREVPPLRGSVLAQLMAADGLDSGFAGVAEADWRAHARRTAAALKLQPGASLFEVGCGAGAYLYEFDQLGFEVGGIDRSAALIARATEVFPHGRFRCADASALDPAEQVDAVISFGVFLYFDSLDYARSVLAAMAAKARHAVAVLDLPDAALQAEAVAEREQLAGGAAEYAARYAGLEHRYYERDWVARTMTELGLTTVTITDQQLAGYANAPFRFSAWGFVGG